MVQPSPIIIPLDHQNLIQFVFDRFAASGRWPRSRDVQIACSPRDYWTDILRIDDRLITIRGDKLNVESETILSIHGIELCTGSEEHIQLFLRTLQVCADWFKSHPDNPSFTERELLEILDVDEQVAHTAFELLYTSRGVWDSISRPTESTPASLRLNPDVLLFDGVTSFAQYVEILERHRHQSITSTEQISLRDRVQLFSQRSWKQFVALATGAGVVLVLAQQLRECFRLADDEKKQSNKGQFLQAHLADFEKLIAKGDLGEAREFFQSGRKQLSPSEQLPPPMLLESLLAECYSGARKWDSYDPTGRLTLLKAFD